MLQSVSIEGYTSFPGVRWRLLDPTTELVLRVEGRAESQVLESYGQWFEWRSAGCFRFGEERFPDGWLANPGEDPLAVHLAAGITALQRLACQPVRRAQVLEAEDQLIRLALPSFSGPVLQGAIQLAIQLLLELEADPAGTGERLQLLEEELEQFAQQAPEVSRCGEDAMHFAPTASALGIPVVSTATGFLEIGHGCARRVLSNSLCLTPAPAAALASDKLASYLVLHRAGLPVPATQIVNTEAELEAAAAEIGWPLVVKPLDQSCQQGVTTDVADQISLQAAFLVARNLSKASVLVQEQVLGQEFRLTAIGPNQAFARALNVAFVEGDGSSTVAQLVLRSNANPLIGGHPGAIAHGIELDSVAMAELAAQELSAQSIPMAGQKVRLSRLPFRSLGGITTDATTSIHPSYFELLQRAARVLQLDVIGIDLITADPARPWWEVGAKILECNSRPGIIQHEFPGQAVGIHASALKHWLGEIATPPLIAVAAGEQISDVCAAVEASLSVLLVQHQAVGVLCEGICRMGATDYPLAASAASQTGQSLLAEPACGAAVLAWRSDDLVAYGRPCETVDAAVLAAGAEPLVVREILDANPSAVVWLGHGMQESSEQITAWQARSPGSRLVELRQSRELIELLPKLLGASTHQLGGHPAVSITDPYDSDVTLHEGAFS